MDEKQYAILLAKSAAETAIAMNPKNTNRNNRPPLLKIKPSIFDMITENNSYDVMLIINEFANLSNTTTEEILGDSRKMPLCAARHVLIYALYETIGLSAPQLGRIFNRDHSTILNSIHAGEKIVFKNAFLKKHIDGAFEKAKLEYENEGSQS